MNMYYTTPFFPLEQLLRAILSRNTFLGLFLILSAPVLLIGQADIEWQKTFGTPYGDNAFQVFPDESGNMIVIGLETHADFTGNLRPYMMTAKIDPAGKEIWKTYHDVAFNTFNPPVDYTIRKHSYTEEFGDTLLNLVISIQQRVIQYKINDRTGAYYSYEDVSSAIIDISRENEKVYASVLCAVQQSCYGPDSLIVQHWDPTPDSSIFNPIVWTFGLKQNFRTAPIQGHYDFDTQEIHMDGKGNAYLLVQIERWNFQFCTDCPDTFVDAWNEVFKFDSEGNLLAHINLKTTKAVVSSMKFVRLVPGQITIQINDINASGTKLLTTIFRLNENLEILKEFEMDEAYSLLVEDTDQKLYACRNIFDASDPQIKGLSDVLVSGFNADGVLLWNEYFGGSNWDFPRALALGGDGSLYFLTNTESTDFDVLENFGGQDIWLAKLSENGVTAVEDHLDASSLYLFPNPAVDMVYVVTGEPLHISVYDMQSKEVLRLTTVSAIEQIDVNSLPQGCYILKAVNEHHQVFTARVIKL